MTTGRPLHTLKNLMWRHSRKIKFGLDLAIWTFTIPLALWLRAEDQWVLYRQGTAILLLLAIPLFAVAIREFGFFRQSWADLSTADLNRLVLGVGLASIALFLEGLVLARELVIPRSVPILSGLLALAGLLGMRVLFKTGVNWYRGRLDKQPKRVLLIGSGSAGRAMVSEMRDHPELGLRPVGFLDDDPNKRGLEYQGVPVWGPTRDLPAAFEALGADEAVLAMPSAPLSLRRELMELADRHHIPIRTIPDFAHALQNDDPEHLKQVMEMFVRRGKAQNVLLIGGAGYIGSALIPKLLDAGYRVRVLDTLLYGTEPIAPYLDHPRFSVTEGDFRQINRLVEAMQGIDTVVHLGAIVGDPACALDEDLTTEVNLIATKMVAEVAKGYGVERFVFASTCSVYGASEDVLDENSKLNPVSLYARTKIASEKVLRRMTDDQFRPVILRFGTVYGFSGRTRFDLVVNLLTAKAVREGKITLYGGDQWRPFVHVHDVAKALLAVLDSPLEKVGGEIFNVGSDEQNYTLEDVAVHIKQEIPHAEILELGQDADRRNYRVDFSKLRNTVGFTPDWTLREGIRQVKEVLENGDMMDHTLATYSNVRFLTEEGLSKIVRREFGSTMDLLNEPGP